MRAILLCMRCALASHNCTKLAPNATHNTCVLSRVTGFDAVGCVRAPIFASHPISPFHQPVRSSDHQYHQYATISPSAYPISRSAHQPPAINTQAHQPIRPSAHQPPAINTRSSTDGRWCGPPPPSIYLTAHPPLLLPTIGPSAHFINQSDHQIISIISMPPSAHQPIPSADQPISHRPSTPKPISPSAHQPISHRPSTPDHLRMVVGVALHLRRYTLPHIHPSSSQPSAHQPTT